MTAPTKAVAMMSPAERDAFLSGVQFALLWLNVPAHRRDDVLGEANRTVEQWVRHDDATA